VVIERTIQRGAGVRVGDGLLRPEPAPDLPLPAEPLPENLEPPRQDQSRDDQFRQDQFRQELPLFSGPAFAMPADVPVPLPGSTPPPVQTRPLDQSLFEPETPEPAPPSRVRATASAAGRILRRTPPPLVNPRPDVASERSAVTAPETAPPSLALPAGEARTVDPAVLSDMARQLEVALRRPSSAVTPPPGRPAAAEPAAQPTSPAEPAPAERSAAPHEAAPAQTVVAPPQPDPIAAAMATQAASPPAAPPQPEPAPPAPVSTPEPPRAAEPPPRPAEAPPRAGTAPPPPPPPPPPEAKPAAEPVTPNPFSVEEIEAEFARLLGRPLDKKG